MTQNQLSSNHGKNGSDGVMFSVDGGGNIQPKARAGRQTVPPGERLVTEAVTSGTTTFNGHVCARGKDKECQCSTLVDGVSSGGHMAIGTGYTIKSSVPLNSTFALYAVTDSGTIPNASNGDIVIGTT